ncbi:MAG: hypothetical protein ACRDFW_05410 [bacterium]
MKEKELVQILSRLYPSSRWPKPFNLLQGKLLLRSGKTATEAAREVGTTAARLNAMSKVGDAITGIFGAEQPDDDTRKNARQILGNLIVGKCAEITFEEIYKEHTQTTELELRDLREGRSDTDYRLFNGRGRPVYRVNIKFHGSVFRRAKEMVNLDPEDCFALATYKIDGALQKQRKDELPYIFVIVSVPNLTAESIGSGVPADLQDFVSRVMASKAIPRKRNIEDRIVDVLKGEGHLAFDSTRRRIADAKWYVLGAKKADLLLRSLLFERVFALRTRNFSRQFRGAELDMHFSLSNDLTPLTTYLEMLKEAGYPRVTTLLERGDY